MQEIPLNKVLMQLEPDPVVLVTTKFKKFKLTPLKAKSVEAPLIKECLANIECRVMDYIEK